MELKPGYKQTEVGVIPEDWEVCPVRQKGEVITGKALAVNAPGKQRPYLRTKNVFDGRIDIEDVLTMPMTDEQFVQFQIRAGDVLLNEGQSLELVGRCAIYRNEYQKPCAIQNALLRFRARTGVSDEFASYLFRRCQQAGVFAQIALQTTSIAHLGGSRLERLPLAWPPTLAEQQAIAEALSDADALIDSLEQLIAKKRHLKQGAMQDLLTGKKRLPGFEGEWEVTTVGEKILKSFCGPSPTCEERNVDGGEEWGVLKTTAITWQNGWDWKRHKTLPKSYWNQPNIELKTGDVLVTKAGPRHRVGVAAWVDYVPEKIIPSGKMIALRPLPGKAIPLMLSAAIASPEAQSFLDQRTTGMAESQVNYENTVLLETPIKLPTPAEQTAIAAILSDMDAEIATLEAKLSKARQVKQGMMQELLTGKTRLV